MFIKRDIFRDATTTGQSFKSWDTCMDNNTCKIIAIVGIVLATLILLWILSSIFRCCFYSISCLEACCSCCCRSKSKAYTKQVPNVYENYNMYPVNEMKMNNGYGNYRNERNDYGNYRNDRNDVNDRSDNFASDYPPSNSMQMGTQQMYQPQQAYLPRYEPVRGEDIHYRSNL